MPTRLSLKRGHYSPATREGVAPSKNDDAFTSALNKAAQAEHEMERAATKCLYDACRMLVRAASQFDPDDNLRVLVTKLRATMEEGVVPPLAVAINVFLSNERGNLAAETPESRFLYAASCLEDAVHDWGKAEYVAAHANTVRCRASLKTITD